MTTEISANKMRSVLWWITSIAISVLCCSVLFVLFASYMVDIKEHMADDQMRINMLEERQNALVMQLETLHRTSTAPEAAMPTTQAPVAMAPASPMPAGSAAPAVSPPTIDVPSVPVTGAPSPAK